MLMLLACAAPCCRIVERVPQSRSSTITPTLPRSNGYFVECCTAAIGGDERRLWADDVKGGSHLNGVVAAQSQIETEPHRRLPAQLSVRLRQARVGLRSSESTARSNMLVPLHQPEARLEFGNARFQRRSHRSDFLQREPLGDVLRTVPLERLDDDQEPALHRRAVTGHRKSGQRFLVI